MFRIKKGDTVRVISGNYKGKTGVVLSFKGLDRCVVEGINIRKKAVKKQTENDTGFMEVFAPIHISNVALSVDHEDKKFSVKLRARLLKGKKELYYKIGSSEFIHRIIPVNKLK